MICKWCATAVNPGDKVCPKCGRELPSLTDCGGFGNITRGLVNNPPTVASATQPKSSQQASPKSQQSAGRASQTPAASNNGMLGMLHGLVAVVLLVVILILLIGIRGNIEDLNGQYKEMHKHLESMEEELDDLDCYEDWDYEDYEDYEEDDNGDDENIDDILPGDEVGGADVVIEDNNEDQKQPVKKNVVFLGVSGRDNYVCKVVDAADGYVQGSFSVTQLAGKVCTFAYTLDDESVISFTPSETRGTIYVKLSENPAVSSWQIHSGEDWVVADKGQFELSAASKAQNLSVIIEATSATGQEYIILVDIDMSKL